MITGDRKKRSRPFKGGFFVAVRGGALSLQNQHGYGEDDDQKGHHPEQSGASDAVESRRLWRSVEFLTPTGVAPHFFVSDAQHASAPGEPRRLAGTNA